LHAQTRLRDVALLGGQSEVEGVGNGNGVAHLGKRHLAEVHASELVEPLLGRNWPGNQTFTFSEHFSRMFDWTQGANLLSLMRRGSQKLLRRDSPVPTHHQQRILR